MAAVFAEEGGADASPLGVSGWLGTAAGLGRRLVAAAERAAETSYRKWAVAGAREQSQLEYDQGYGGKEPVPSGQPDPNKEGSPDDLVLETWAYCVAKADYHGNADDYVAPAEGVLTRHQSTAWRRRKEWSKLDCGEDSFFSSNTRNSVGIADGVGAWRELSVDPSDISNTLMARAKALSEGDAEPTVPRGWTDAGGLLFMAWGEILGYNLAKNRSDFGFLHQQNAEKSVEGGITGGGLVYAPRGKGIIAGQRSGTGHYAHKKEDGSHMGVIDDGFNPGYEEASPIVRGGSTTALIATLETAANKPTGRAKGTLRVANLGDCGLCVARAGKVHYRAVELYHALNVPYQLSIPLHWLPKALRYKPTVRNAVHDEPEDAWLERVPVQEDDFVILGTDGFFGNIPVAEAARWSDMLLNSTGDYSEGGWLSWRTKGARAEVPRHRTRDAVKVWVNEAKRRAVDKKYWSPFSQQMLDASGDSREDPDAVKYATGGKADDITLVVARVVRRRNYFQEKGVPTEEARRRMERMKAAAA